MTKNHPLACALMFLLSVAASAPAFAVPTMQYSQDGKTFHSLSLLMGTESAENYYNFNSNSGHPGFGLAKKTATASLYWDATDGMLSLIFISGNGIGDKGGAKMKITGLPSAASLGLSDHGTFAYSSGTGTLTGQMAYRNTTDGFSLDGLENSSFTAKMTLSNVRGIKSLRLTSGDPANGGVFQPLKLKLPLFLRSTVTGSGSQPALPGVGSGVPEPTSLGILSLIAGALMRRNRRAR